MENTNYKGKVTELQVLLYITQLGYSVSIPYGDKDRYDQIWDIDGKLLRVQIKTASALDEENSAIQFSCKSTCNGKAHLYTGKEIDYFATFWDNKCYLIPVSECSNSKKLRFFNNKSNQIKGINWAKDYEVEEVLKKL